MAYHRQASSAGRLCAAGTLFLSSQRQPAFLDAFCSVEALLLRQAAVTACSYATRGQEGTAPRAQNASCVESPNQTWAKRGRGRGKGKTRGRPRAFSSLALTGPRGVRPSRLCGAKLTPREGAMLWRPRQRQHKGEALWLFCGRPPPASCPPHAHVQQYKHAGQMRAPRAHPGRAGRHTWHV